MDHALPFNHNVCMKCVCAMCKMKNHILMNGEHTKPGFLVVRDHIGVEKFFTFIQEIIRILLQLIVVFLALL